MKKILLSTLTASALSINISASTDAAILGSINDSIYTQTQTMVSGNNLNISNSLLSAKVEADGNKARDSVINTVGKAGGKYGVKAANIATQCFDLPSLPSLFESLDIGGLDFCGVGEVNDILNELIKDGKESIEEKGKTTVKNVKEDTNNLNGNQEQAFCTDSVNEDKSKCIDAGNKFDKQVDRIIKKETNHTNISDMNKGFDFLSSETEMTYMERKDGYHNRIMNMTINPTESNITNYIDDIKRDDEKKLANRESINKNIEMEYQLRYNPEYVFMQDTGYNKLFNELKNESEFVNKPIVYITPLSKELSGLAAGVEIEMFDVNNYKQGADNFNQNMKKTNMDDDIDMMKKLGGITPLTSSISGYKQFSNAMGENIYTDKKSASESENLEEGENGELGMQFGMIQGIKGTMYQLMILNQQMDSQNRSNYNMQILNHNEKMKIKMDEVNNKLDVQITQNARMIQLLEKLTGINR